MLSSLTKEQTKALEDVQCRALQIINNNISYEEACSSLNTPLLTQRRLDLCQTFTQIVRQDAVLHYLLPRCDIQLTGRLTKMYHAVYAKTNHLKASSFLYGLNELQ